MGQVARVFLRDPVVVREHNRNDHCHDVARRSENLNLTPSVLWSARPFVTGSTIRAFCFRNQPLMR